MLGTGVDPPYAFAKTQLPRTEFGGYQFATVASVLGTGVDTPYAFAKTANPGTEFGGYPAIVTSKLNTVNFP